MEEKKRYSDEELEEFRAIINQKLEIAKSDYEETMKVLMNKNTNDVNDTSPTYKALEEGSTNQTKEELVQMAQRQQKFIQGLQAALIRIDNKNIRYRSNNGRTNSQGTPQNSATRNTQRGIEAG